MRLPTPPLSLAALVPLVFIFQRLLGSSPAVDGFSATPSLQRNHQSSTFLSASAASDAVSPSPPPPPPPSSLTLYGHPGTRSPLVNWAMHELGLDFDMGDLSRNPHPFRKIPCLTDRDGSTVVFESGAILIYLLDAYATNQNDNGSTTKALTPNQKAAVTSWIVWANASLDPVCFLETPQGKVYDTGLKRTSPGSPQPLIDRLNELLGQQQYLVATEEANNGNDDGGGGDDSIFTIADVAVGSYLLYVPQFFPDADISQWPHVVRYMKDCAERKAYGQAFGTKVQGFLLERLDSFVSEAKEEEGQNGGSVLNSIRGLFN